MEIRDKDGVTYYYNRERRLAKASEEARFAANASTRKRPGLFGSLVATRGLRFMFMSMVLFVVAAFIANYLKGTDDKGSLAGYSVSLSALWFEGDVYVSVNRKPAFLKAAPVPVAFSVSAGVGGDPVDFQLPAGELSAKAKIAAADKPELAVAVVRSGEEKLELAVPVK